MKIEHGKFVKLEYTLTVEGVGVIESSDSRGPLEYVHGVNALPMGLEKELEGLDQGAEKEGTIEVEIPTIDVSRKDFPDGSEFEPGATFTGKHGGQEVEFVVVEVDGDKVVIRPQHPLAGKKLSYKVKILEIKDEA